MSSLLSSVTDAVEADSERRRRVLEALIATQTHKERVKAEKQRKEAADRQAHPIWKRDAEHRRLAEERRRAAAAEEAKRELGACTFVPAVNPRSREMASGRQKQQVLSPTVSRAMKAADGSMERNTVANLYPAQTEEAWMATLRPSNGKGASGRPGSPHSPTIFTSPIDGYSRKSPTRSSSPAVSEGHKEEHEAGRRSTYSSSRQQREREREHHEDGPKEYDPKNRQQHFTAEMSEGRRKSTTTPSATPQKAQPPVALSLAGYTPKPLEVSEPQKRSHRSSTATTASVGASNTAELNGKTPAIQPPPPPGRPPEHYSRGTTRMSEHAVAAGKAAEADARFMVSHAVASGIDEAVLRQKASSGIVNTATGADSEEDEFLAATGPVVERAVAKAMQALGIAENRRLSLTKNIEPAYESADASPPSEQTEMEGVPIEMDIVATPTGETYRLPRHLRLLLEEEGAAKAKEEFDVVLERTREGDKEEFERRIHSLKDAHARDMTGLHEHYEKTIEALSEQPSENQVFEFVQLSDKFVAAEKERNALFVSESAARRDAENLRNELAATKAKMETLEKDLRGALRTLQQERDMVAERLMSAERELKGFQVMHDTRVTQLAKDHETALSIMRSENEKSIDALISEHAKVLKVIQENKARELAAMQSAVEEKVMLLTREKDQALSALQTAKDVEVEAAIAAAEAKAASTVLAVAASIGIPELSSPRRAGLRFPTSPVPASKAAAASQEGGNASGTSTPNRKPYGSAHGSPQVMLPVDANFAELLEALAGEVSTSRADAHDHRSQRESAAAALARVERELANKTEQLELANATIEELNARVKELEDAAATASSQRGSLEAERKAWLEQMEKDNAMLRSLFQDARNAKEQMLAEMASLEEDRTRVDIDRVAYQAREAQLVQYITVRGLSVPPLVQLPAQYAIILARYQAGGNPPASATAAAANQGGIQTTTLVAAPDTPSGMVARGLPTRLAPAPPSDLSPGIPYGQYSLAKERAY